MKIKSTQGIDNVKIRFNEEDKNIKSKIDLRMIDIDMEVLVNLFYLFPVHFQQASVWGLEAEFDAGIEEVEGDWQFRAKSSI